MIYLHTNGIDILLNNSSKKADFSQTILTKLRKYKRIKIKVVNILYKEGESIWIIFF